MPPSFHDIGMCAQLDKAVHRIVDPRGMWEYRCDKESPMIASVKEKKVDLLKPLPDLHGLEEILVTENDAKYVFDASIDQNISDAELAKIISKYIQKMEEKGVYMSYTPFKEDD